MSIATVTTRGYASFSTVNQLPTRGYSVSAAPATVPPPIEEFVVDFVFAVGLVVDFAFTASVIADLEQVTDFEVDY